MNWPCIGELVAQTPEIDEIAGFAGAEGDGGAGALAATRGDWCSDPETRCVLGALATMSVS
jgi:hypothetical protein